MGIQKSSLALPDTVVIDPFPEIDGQHQGPSATRHTGPQGDVAVQQVPAAEQFETLSARRSMASGNAKRQSIGKLALFTLAASAPVVAAKTQKAAQWTPDPKGPQYPDPVFDGLGTLRCYGYARNDPWHMALLPGLVDDLVEDRLPPTAWGRLQLAMSASHFDCPAYADAQRKDGAVDPLEVNGGQVTCPPGYHPVHGRLAEQGKLAFWDFTDYHAVRMNQDGSWSHFIFEKGVTNKDSSGKIITDPEAANFNYGPRMNYVESCGTLCHPSPRWMSPVAPQDEAKGEPAKDGSSWTNAPWFTGFVLAAGSIVVERVLGRLFAARPRQNGVGPAPARGRERHAAAGETPRVEGGAAVDSESDASSTLQLRIRQELQAGPLSQSALRKKAGQTTLQVKATLAQMESDGSIRSQRDADGITRYRAIG